jgi:hypothetical protein
MDSTKLKGLEETIIVATKWSSQLIAFSERKAIPAERKSQCPSAQFPK